MPKKTIPCIICASENANEITKRILAGEPLKILAEEYGFGRATMFRHRSRCLYAAKLVHRKQTKITQVLQKTVFDRVRKISERFDAAFEYSEKQGQLAAFTAIGRELRETLRLEHEIGKESQDAGFAMNIVDQALPERCPHCNARLTQCELSDTR